VAKGRYSECYSREFVPTVAIISSHCGHGVLIWRGVLFGRFCMLYNMIGYMAVVCDVVAVRQNCDAVL